MKNYPLNKHYRVYKNGTSVTELSINDFKSQDFKIAWPGEYAGGVGVTPANNFSLPLGDKMFYEYYDKVKAMKMAKSGALSHINSLIKDAEQAIDKLKSYRDEHYEGLNIDLLDLNIRRLEKEMKIK